MASIIDSHYLDREVIGFVEPVTIIKSNRSKKIVEARIDSGATKCSIDQQLVEELKLGPILGESVIKNANGTARRKTIEITFVMSGKTITEIFTIADRSKMMYPVLVGRNTLRKGFLIDPNKRSRILPKEQTKLEGFNK
jgi:hypothetical protein